MGRDQSTSPTLVYALPPSVPLRSWSVPGGERTKYWLSETGLEFIRSMMGSSVKNCPLGT